MLAQRSEVRSGLFQRGIASLWSSDERRNVALLRADQVGKRLADAAVRPGYVGLQDLFRQRHAMVDQGQVGPEVVAEQFGQERVTALWVSHWSPTAAVPPRSAGAGWSPTRSANQIRSTRWRLLPRVAAPAPARRA